MEKWPIVSNLSEIWGKTSETNSKKNRSSTYLFQLEKWQHWRCFLIQHYWFFCSFWLNFWLVLFVFATTESFLYKPIISKKYSLFFFTRSTPTLRWCIFKDRNNRSRWQKICMLKTNQHKNKPQASRASWFRPRIAWGIQPSYYTWTSILQTNKPLTDFWENVRMFN